MYSNTKFSVLNKRLDAVKGVQSILEYLDCHHEGTVETPERFVKFLDELRETQAPFSLTTFDAEQYDEMITQTDIPFFSLCEHHLLPFFGKAAVAYVPNGKIIGLSKLARLVRQVAASPQNQERITTMVCDRLTRVLDCRGIGVSLTARHLCMEMRGVKVHDTYTTTTALRGVFMKPEVRAEFLNAIKRAP